MRRAALPHVADRREPTGADLDLRAALRTLAAVDQQLLGLTLEGSSTAEAAQALGPSPGTARTRLTRARQRLRNQLGPAGFRSVLDTSPAAFIREVRLTRAHDELVVADATRTTVGTVARQWGFPHLGRFAEQYRGRYGRNPSETLAG